MEGYLKGSKSGVVNRSLTRLDPASRDPQNALNGARFRAGPGPFTHA